MKADILEIITQHKAEHISSEQAVAEIIQLFLGESEDIKKELKRRVGIIESETDDFTRQAMIAMLTDNLII